MNDIEKLIFAYTEIVRILRENNKKYDSPLSVAIRDRAIETYEQVIFDLEPLKNLPNELRAVNRNEFADEFFKDFLEFTIKHTEFNKPYSEIKYLVHEYKKSFKNGAFVR